jgi:hypothetical protein
MMAVRQLSTAELEQGLDHILQSPRDDGTLELIVKRPDTDQRESVAAARLDTEPGVSSQVISYTLTWT